MHNRGDDFQENQQLQTEGNALETLETVQQNLLRSENVITD
jgi:hypothetical protein